MILRDYQSRLVSRAKKALETDGNTICVAPTGSGKTICLSALAGAMQPAKTLILQHREELVNQNLSKFQKVNPGLPVSLFTANVKSWRGKAVFGMVQTLSRPNNLETIPSLNLMIVDEAHHVAAESYKRIIEAAKEKNPDLMLAGFTATPSRGDGKGLRSAFNNVADQIGIRELIDKGFLVRPRAFVVDINGVREGLSRVRKLKEDFDMQQVSEVMNKVPINEEVVRKWKEMGENRRTIVFCSTVQHAVDVRDAFMAEGISTEIITGETPAPERAGVYRRIKSGETRVCVNVAVLTEGFDEPCVSCVVLLRPCSQKSTMIQMIGRGLRTINMEEYPGMVKKDCLILDFGTSILTHGNVDAEVNLGKGEKMNEGASEGLPARKICPTGEDTTGYILPDRNGAYGCGTKVPAGVKICPLCGFIFDKPGEVQVEEVVLTEVDLLDASPFRWVDLFGSGKVMIASGFEAWAGIFSLDNENWHALGKLSSTKMLSRLLIGDRTQALAAADDFLRQNESSDSAKKSKRWLQHPASEKQSELLRRFGYDVDPLGMSFTKYTASSHLNFQFNRRLIEHALGVR
jgi:superfamily II DNA or RNA helicase